jgi:hypothetical protein
MRLWLAMILLIIALSILVLATLPFIRYQQVLPMPPVILPEPVSFLFWGWL